MTKGAVCNYWISLKMKTIAKIKITKNNSKKEKTCTTWFILTVPSIFRPAADGTSAEAKRKQ